MKISIISPVYGAETIVAELVSRISNVMDSLSFDYEIILVEDGSPDKSWDEIEQVCSNNKLVSGIKLSRNFGQHYAITAGLHTTTGDAVIVMDCDLQDNPKYIPILIDEWKKGNDIVYTKKKERKHSWIKNFTARLFNLIFNYLVDNKSWENSVSIGSYSLLSRKVVDSFLSVKDYRRHYLMVLRWLGYSYSIIEIQHEERFAGKSSYNLSKLIVHALDGITSQSDKLLKLTMVLGFVISTISFLAAIVVVSLAIYTNFSHGWSSLFVLILFIGGLIISSIGISGIYIGKIYEQSKGRPLYIIEKRLNL